MSKKRPTSFVLNETIQKIKEELTPIYGLKNILSAGLLLFSRLSDTEQKRIIAEVNEENITEKQSFSSNIKSVRDILKEVASAEKQTPGILVEILSEKDSIIADEIRKALGPEPAQKKKARGG